MHTIRQKRFALPSLLFSLLMGIITLAHHLHSAWVLHPDGGGMHVVWNEMILIPATCLSMYFYLKNESKVALFIYMLIAVSGFVFLGLYEGGWNHTGKLLAYLRIDSPYTQIGDILPKNNGHLWFYEITGVLTFVIAMIAFWYSARFYLGVRNTVRNK